ncbi:unnamed protein product, partial [Iphiclides podalirius]
MRTPKLLNFGKVARAQPLQRGKVGLSLPLQVWAPPPTPRRALGQSARVSVIRDRYSELDTRAIAMALWTPYAEDAALDLSTKCKEVTVSETYGRVPYTGYPYPSELSQHPYPGYRQYVPVAEGSPLSGTSTCSYMTAISPRIGVISPPASPTSHHVTQPSADMPSYMVDVDTLSDDPDFQAFERDALRVMAEKNGGTLLGNNPRMRRAVQTSQAADDSYRKQRERNNYAAKQSRDRRKLREIHLALKVTYLRNELTKLKGQLASRSCVRCHQAYPY